MSSTLVHILNFVTMSSTLFHILNFMAMAAGIYICCRAYLRSKRRGYLLIVLYLALSFAAITFSVIQGKKVAEFIRTSHPLPAGVVRATVREAHFPPRSILLVAGLFLIVRGQECPHNQRIEADQ